MLQNYYNDAGRDKQQVKKDRKKKLNAIKVGGAELDTFVFLDEWRATVHHQLCYTCSQ